MQTVLIFFRSRTIHVYDIFCFRLMRYKVFFFFDYYLRERFAIMQASILFFVVLKKMWLCCTVLLLLLLLLLYGTKNRVCQFCPFHFGFVRVCIVFTLRWLFVLDV